MKNNMKNNFMFNEIFLFLVPSQRFDPEADCEFHILFNCTCYWY